MITGSAALREMYRRLRVKNAGGLDSRIQDALSQADIVKSHLFPQQRAVLEDPAPYVLAICSRRSGKSVYVGTACAWYALAYPGSEVAAYSPTLAMSQRNILKPIKQTCRRYNLRAKFDKQHNQVLWANGSVTYLFGADRIDDVDKARGLALHAAFIDEAQRFKETIIDELISEVITPALEDYEGKLYMSGTPKAVLAGYFYRGSEDPESPFSVHRWTVADNIYFPRYVKMKKTNPKYKDWSIRDIAEDRLNTLMRLNGLTRQTPSVQREWFGVWARDVTSLIYPYDPKKNFEASLPDAHEWQFGLGVDVGVNAVVAMAWSKTCPNVYFVDAIKAPFTTMDDLADNIEMMQKKWGAIRITADCAALSKYIIEEIHRRRPWLIIKEAAKTQKRAVQEALRTDLQAGRIKTLPAAKVLVEEWEKLQYEEDGSEPKKADNHCSDGALYIHRWARHFAAKPREEIVEKTEEERIRDQIFEKARRKQLGMDSNPRPNMVTLLRSRRNARP